MSVIHPEAFRRGQPAGFDGVFHWDFLRPAFDYETTGIEPMDFDCVIERKGNLLVFETKSGIKKIPVGQVRSLEEAVRTGVVTVIVLRAKCAAEVDGWDVWFLGHCGSLITRHEEGDASDLVAFCHRWFEKASRQPTDGFLRGVAQRAAARLRVLADAE